MIFKRKGELRNIKIHVNDGEQWLNAVLFQFLHNNFIALNIVGLHRNTGDRKGKIDYV